MGSGMEPRFSRRLYLLAAMFFFLFMGAGAQQAYLVPYLSRLTPWTPVQCSAVIAAVYFSMLLFRVLNVYLFPRWSDRRFSLVGSFVYLFFCLAMWGIARVPSYPVALTCAVLWGAGGAMMWTGSAMQTMALADAAGGRHGTGMGVLYASTHAGWLAGVILQGNIYKALSPSALPWFYTVPAGITLVGNLLALRLPASGPALRETPPLLDLLALVLRPQALIAGVLQFTSALAFGIVLGGFGRYVQDAYGAEWIWVSVSFYPATRMVLSFVSGRLTDRLGATPVLCLGFLAGAVGLTVLVHWSSPLAAVLTGLTLGLLSSTVPVVASALVGSSAGVKRRPLVYGVVFMWRDLGVGVAAVGISLLGQKIEPGAGFSVFAWLFGACALLSLYLGRFAGEEI